MDDAIMADAGGPLVSLSSSSSAGMMTLGLEIPESGREFIFFLPSRDFCGEEEGVTSVLDSISVMLLLEILL